MVFIKIFKVIIILTKIKLKIRLPKSCDILCYDEGRRFNLGIKKLFKSFKTDIIYVRLEEINVLIILKSIISKILNLEVSFKNHYIKNYCYQVNPKIILSTAYYDESFLYLKEIIPKKIKTILVQRCPYKDSDFSFREKKINIDQVYLFNHKSKKIIDKYFITKKFILGSFNNNNQKKNEIKKSSILIVSGYKKNFEILDTSENNEYYLNTIHEKKMIKLILNHLSKKYKIKILLKPDVKKSDYLNYSGINSKYVFENKGKSYKFIDESELVITFNNGTMGHESISRGVKNIQIPRPKLSKSKKFNIYNGTLEDKKIIFFLSSIFKMSIKTYFKKMNKFYEEIIYFNENNILLKKNLKNLIIKN